MVQWTAEDWLGGICNYLKCINWLRTVEFGDCRKIHLHKVVLFLVELLSQEHRVLVFNLKLLLLKFSSIWAHESFKEALAFRSRDLWRLNEKMRHLISQSLHFRGENGVLTLSIVHLILWDLALTSRTHFLGFTCHLYVRRILLNIVKGDS